MNPSLRARLLIAVMQLRRERRDLEDLARFRRGLPKRDDAADVAPPPAITAKFTVSRSQVGGRPVFRVDPPGGAIARSPIVYLHGGGFFLQIRDGHWWTAGELARRSGRSVIVPIYPLTPFTDCDAGSEWMLEVWRTQVESLGGGPRQREDDNKHPAAAAIVGDSAGGGLALALCQRLRSGDLEQPKLAVLLSPWLDLTMTRPASGEELEGSDPMLAPPGLAEAGRLWAGNRSTSDPLVSPVNADLAGLPPIAVHAGTRDILIADARRLAARAHAAGHEISLAEYRGLFHVFMTIPMPETARALDAVAAQIAAANR
ncbi:MAG: alpha/beta hydrolase fold domain-containing protein [Solirubrobacterales bacterium]